jgi:uncharacterized tellurite resistance protein B-like protein
MAAQPQIVNLLDSLGSESDFTEIGLAEEILLTPYLTLVCALLYMMASDGNLGEQESSHLQGVLGGDGKVLSYGLRYVQTVPVEKFLADAPELLSSKDKWCILTNVCDALLSDGHTDDAELALFSRLASAFGVPEKKFQPSLSTLKLKNDKKILGRYAGVKADRPAMTPHFALAASLLYMLTADGSVGAEEVGQLEAVIGEFEGLQNVALKYVRSVKLKPFLDEASATLNQEQKLYILINVCDSMLSDGLVARLEDKVFISMVQAFGFDEASFAPYYQVLETKNLKPFECSFKNRAVHQHASTSEQQKVDVSHADAAANQGVWTVPEADLGMGSAISRTMQDNIQSVKDSFGTQDNVVKVGLNAIDGLNLQKLGDDDEDQNRQKLDLGPDDEANRQKVAEDLLRKNRQQLEQGQMTGNQQRIANDLAQPHVEPIETEARLQNIHEVVGAVNKRLDHFERQNFSFLQVGRAERFDDSFAPIPEEGAEINRQRVDTSRQERGTIRFVNDPNANQPIVPANEAAMLQPKALVEADTVSALALSHQRAKDQRHTSAVGEQTQSRNLRTHGLRMTRLNYVQLIMAFATLMFAAPISTKTSISRLAVGPLVVLSQDAGVEVHDLN